jgi:phytoene dehydrogenase-like protein
MDSGRERDVVVVGGGHNGLACAAYLAKSGLDVLVLEGRDILGGAAATEETWPGYQVSSASYVVSLMPPRIVEPPERRLDVGVRADHVPHREDALPVSQVECDIVEYDLFRRMITGPHRLMIVPI